MPALGRVNRTNAAFAFPSPLCALHCNELYTAPPYNFAKYAATAWIVHFGGQMPGWYGRELHGTVFSHECHKLKSSDPLILQPTTIYSRHHNVKGDHHRDLIVFIGAYLGGYCVYNEHWITHRDVDSAVPPQSSYWSTAISLCLKRNFLLANI